MNKQFQYYKSERGSAGFKAILLLGAFAIALNALLNYVPVAYKAEDLKQEMNAAVMKGLTIPPSSGTPVDVTKKRIVALVSEVNSPENTFYDVKLNNGVLEARVAFTKRIPLLPFGFYDYDYKFDHSCDSRGFLTKF